MKTKIIVFAAAMFLALAGLTIAFAQQSGQTTETAIQATKKVHTHQFNISTSPETIPELLAKTTGDLILRGGHVSELGGLPWPVPPPYPPNYLTAMACEADAALVGTAQTSTSYMTDDERFLLTDWTFTVEEVLKNNPKSAIASGATIVVTRPGGILTINARTVRAIEENFRSFKKDERYLLFLEYSPELKTYKATAENGFQFEGDKVVRLTRNLLHPRLEAKDPQTLLLDTRAAVSSVVDNAYCAGGAKPAHERRFP